MDRAMGSVIFRAAVFAIIYWITVKIAVELVYPASKIALFWPPNAIAAAVLIFSHRRQWPVYLLAMAGAYFAARLPGGQLPLFVYVVFCAANLAEVLIVALVTRKLSEGSADREGIGRLLFVCALAAIPASLVSAVMAAAAVSAGVETAIFWKSGVGWFTGDLSGMLLTLPVLLSWFRAGVRPLRSFTLGRSAESLVLLMLLVGMGVAASTYKGDVFQVSLIFPYLVFPLLIWAGLRLDVRVATLAVLMVGLFAVGLTLLGQGPFSYQGISSFAEVVLMKVGLITIAMTTVILASVVSDRKEAEVSLRRSEKGLKDYAEASSDWFWAMDQDLRFIYMSDRVEIVTGVPVEYHIGKTRAELAGDQVESPAWEAHLKALERHVPFRGFHYPRIAPDGSIQHISTSGVPVFDDAGSFVGYHGVGSDVTDQVKAEEQRRTDVERLNFALQGMNDGVWDWNVVTGHVYFSPRLETMMGYQTGELAQDVNTWTSSVHADDLPKVLKVLKAHLEGEKESYETEHRVKTKTGDWLWILDRGRVVEWSKDAKPLRMVGGQTDISARKKAEEGLLHAKDEAEAANKAKSQFLSSMSHELRTPLNAVIGFGQLLDDPTNPLNQEQMSAVKHILDGGSHLLNLVNEVLELAEIESGNLALSIEPVSAQAIIAATMVMAESLGERYGVQVESEVAPDAALTIMADMTRAKQVLLNLLSNGVKYNRPAGSVSLDCTKLEGGWVRFSVTDTGPGIPEDRQDRLFRPFDRLGNSNSTIEGTGIGLTITKELVELMGGRIGFESTVGTGSTFWVEFPATDEAPARAAIVDEVPTAATLATSTAALSSQVRVFYIEDNPANADLMGLIVAKAPNLTLETAETAEDGLARIVMNPPDVILMDINLPGMDGIDATKVLKKNKITKDIPVIAVTANAMDHDVESAWDAGFETYITKPFQVSGVLEAIVRVSNKNGGAASPAGATPPVDKVDDITSMLSADALQIIANSRELLAEDYMDVLRSMFDAIPQLKEEIRNALAEGDAKSVESAAHRMKTNSATLGAMELSDWAQKVETAAKEGSQEVIPDYLAEIEKEYRRVVPAINKLLS